jgi:hypothetical protein
MLAGEPDQGAAVAIRLAVMVLRIQTSPLIVRERLQAAAAAVGGAHRVQAQGTLGIDVCGEENLECS